MGRPFRIILFAALIVTFAAGADEDVYRWVDAAGEEHYTDDVSTIPSRFRQSAKKLEEPPVTRLPSTPVPRANAEDEARAPQGAGASTQDPEVEAEQLWRSRFVDARRRIADLQRQIQADRDLLEALDGGALGPLYTATGAMVPNPEGVLAAKRIEQNKRALVQAREDLVDLERRASWDAVPLEWRRGE